MSCTPACRACPRHKKLCHGDFDPKNIILRDDGEPFILDWAHATQGQRQRRRGRTYLLFWLAGDIGGAESYLNRYTYRATPPGSTCRSGFPLWPPARA